MADEIKLRPPPKPRVTLVHAGHKLCIGCLYEHTKMSTCTPRFVGCGPSHVGGYHRIYVMKEPDGPVSPSRAVSA